jgi:hypothetical protein
MYVTRARLTTRRVLVAPPCPSRCLGVGWDGASAPVGTFVRRTGMISLTALFRFLYINKQGIAYCI